LGPPTTTLQRRHCNLPSSIEARKFTAGAADAVNLGDASDNFHNRRNGRNGISEKGREREKNDERVRTKLMHIGDVKQRSSGILYKHRLTGRSTRNITNDTNTISGVVWGLYCAM
jgi:hypothetical protein